MNPSFFAVSTLGSDAGLSFEACPYGMGVFVVRIRNCGVALSAPDATRLCSYLIEQGFGPKVVIDPLAAFMNADTTIEDIEESVAGAVKRLDEVEDTLKDAHDRIDALTNALADTNEQIEVNFGQRLRHLERRLNSAASELKG